MLGPPSTVPTAGWYVRAAFEQTLDIEVLDVKQLGIEAGRYHG
jgi:hypothetical protein